MQKTSISRRAALGLAVAASATAMVPARAIAMPQGGVGDADLLAIGPMIQDAQRQWRATWDRRNNAEEKWFAARGDFPEDGTAEEKAKWWRESERLQDQFGVKAAEEVDVEGMHRCCDLAYQALDMRATTIEGMQFKLTLEEWTDVEAIMESIGKDLTALASRAVA